MAVGLKLSFTVVTIATAALVSSPQPAALAVPSDSGPLERFDYETRYFRQKIDHFGFADNATFNQRYLIAYKYWNHNGGPILFYTGNEGDITWFCNNTGFMWEVSKELEALLVFAEHRYYGESLPFGNKSFSNLKNLNYFTSEQALADFAVLIRNLKQTIPGALSSPVIAIGGSYGGMLAAWFRMKYPNIVVGALAASAPIWLFENLSPCEGFYNIVTNDFLKSGKGCSESIKNSWDAINKLSSTAEGLNFLSHTFHLCSPLQATDVTFFKSWLSNTWVNLAMVDYPYEANFLQPLPAWPIKVICTFLQNPSLPAESLLQNIFKAVNIYYNYTGNVACLNISQTATSSLDDQGWDYQVNTLTYRACVTVVLHEHAKCIQIKDILLAMRAYNVRIILSRINVVNLWYAAALDVYTSSSMEIKIDHSISGVVSPKPHTFGTCTEMVMPSCSDGINDMFEPMPWDLQSFSDNCKKDWGLRPRPQWITTVYGGKNISSHSNIVFSNGGLDPWASGGVTKSISDTLIAILIPEGAHHLDLRSSNKGDPVSVQKARALEVKYFKKWIEQAKI